MGRSRHQEGFSFGQVRRDRERRANQEAAAERHRQLLVEERRRIDQLNLAVRDVLDGATILVELPYGTLDELVDKGIGQTRLDPLDRNNIAAIVARLARDYPDKYGITNWGANAYFASRVKTPVAAAA